MGGEVAERKGEKGRTTRVLRGWQDEVAQAGRWGAPSFPGALCPPKGSKISFYR